MSGKPAGPSRPAGGEPSTSEVAFQGREVVLSGSDVALFASDMHLGDHDPATAAFFAQALAKASTSATHIFLLGDLFEAWVGDDQPDAVVQDAKSLLAGLVADGRRLFVMRGNRDFLLDVGQQRFSAVTGVVMLEDPCRVDLFGEPVVLAHGDALCTDDLDYQRVRETVRTSAWQEAFLARPLAERLQIGRALRAESEHTKASRPEPSFEPDVNPDAVDALLRSAGSHTLIHGHTHRPACHEWLLDGQRARRWVLSDWEADGPRGGFLRVEEKRGYCWLGGKGEPRSET
jgi:UDP-2,3-diacylglucosamine hydrolase